MYSYKKQYRNKVYHFFYLDFFLISDILRVFVTFPKQILTFCPSVIIYARRRTAVSLCKKCEPANLIVRFQVACDCTAGIILEGGILSLTKVN